MAIVIIEQCHVTPSTDAATEQLLPLLHFDIIWLRFHLMQNLIFYNFQCSESHFLDTIVPNLKNSLSLTLKHFLPLAGKILFPLTSSAMPVSSYAAGEDSISMTIALSGADFVNLTGNVSRDADEFHDFVPQLPPATYSSEFIKISVAAIQVTLFPNQGICIGFTNHHAIGDGVTLVGFLQAWASINKFNEDPHLVALHEKVLPFYDRSVVQDGNRLATIAWNHVKLSRPTVSSTISLPTNKVRGTFVLNDIEIKKIKNFILNTKPAGMTHVSTFVVICAHVWCCLAESAAAAGEEVADDISEYLSCVADCRKRLSPPLPDSYFGNCLALVVAESTHGRLKGNEGFVAAAEAIREAIDKINNEGRILEGYEDRLKVLTKLAGKRVVGIAGSPRFDLYNADYGWGRPEKFESLDIDCNGSVSLSKSKGGGGGGGVEIGLSMPKVKMDAFAAIFNKRQANFDV